MHFLKKQIARTVRCATVVAALCLSASCDDNTAEVGTAIMPESDYMTVSSSEFALSSRSILTDSVLATTNDCRLGRVVDPETQTLTTCDFLAQFHILDNLSLPSKDKMITQDGKVVADSCDIRVFISSYYGDSLNTMKFRVQEMDTANVMEETELYYTDVDPDRFVNAEGYSKDLTFAVRDLTRADTTLNSSSYYKQLRVVLPVEYGTEILNKYYEHPSYFTDSYEFIRHVCPGFVFKTIGGIGTMINVDVSTLNLYFRYHTEDSDGNDTIVEGLQRMAATAEVIQSTSVDNQGLQKLIDEEDGYTYAKSPAGIFTEVDLPISDIVAGEHYTDTILSARIDFVRRNNTVNEKYSLNLPSTLLLVRKCDMYSFFEEALIPDETTSFVASYTSTSNAYSFTNIARLISYCRVLRDKEAGVVSSDSEEERNRKYEAWEQENPEWNKVVLIPVNPVYTTTTNSYGLSSSQLLRLNNEMGLTSTKLVGGDDSDLSISVVYSKFAQ